MDDRELLELAAKAAGYEIEWVRNSGCHYRCEEEVGREQWCPLDDDGDALRLMVELKLSVNSNSSSVGIGGYTADRTHVFVQEDIGPAGSAEAHRCAIVRAAAEIGRSIQDAPQGHRD